MTLNDHHRREISAAVGDNKLSRRAVDLGYALAISDMVETLLRGDLSLEEIRESLRTLNKTGAAIP